MAEDIECIGFLSNWKIPDEYPEVIMKTLKDDTFSLSSEDVEMFKGKYPIVIVGGFKSDWTIDL